MHPQQTGDLPCQRPGLVTSRRRPRPRGRPGLYICRDYIYQAATIYVEPARSRRAIWPAAQGGGSGHPPPTPSLCVDEYMYTILYNII